MGKKVLLGMSGGVDSSVSAILLQKQGYEVIGLTMRLWEPKKDDKEQIILDNKNDAILDAKKVCEKLGIVHHVADLQSEFKEKVVDNFVCTYMCGKTPNPCIECNKFIKFDAFYKLAKEYGCEYIATGHYAKVEFSEKYNQYVLAKSNAELKDQTYFLYGINKEILPNILFPLADFNDKDEIRKIALEQGLEVAQKKDSQEICFVPNNNYIEFLEKEVENLEDIKKEGKIVLKSGEILGKHIGLACYTIGQRKGLGISYKEPLYVIKLDKNRNEVVVGTENELYTKELTAKELNFLLDIDLSKEIEVEAKVRYRAKAAKAILKVENNTAKLTFKEAQRAVTPGQSVVFYLDNLVLGGGKIN